VRRRSPWALELGYRHIDTAQAYGNEESVGQGLRESGVPRDQVFITTKFHPARRDPVSELERSLQRLGVDRVDLYIVHWPKGGPTWAWPGMERAQELGSHTLDRGFQLRRCRGPTVTGNGEHCARRQPGAIQSVRVPEGAP
jgi:Aldo/keto reductases, related to diketogulonate reductase